MDFNANQGYGYYPTFGYADPTVNQYPTFQQVAPQQAADPVMAMIHNTAAAYSQVHFGDLVNVTNPAELQTVGFDATKSVENPDPKGKNAVGLSFGGLTVKEDPKPANFEEPQFNPMFGSLMSGDSGIPVQQKFALQPIPIDLDRSMLPKPDLVSNAIEDVNAHLIKNNGKNYSTRKLSNWFTRMIDQKGEEYFTAGQVTVDDIGRNAEKILDDMISGRIDYNKQGQYIINPIVIETLINYCSNKLAINKAIQFSLGYVYNDYINRMMFSEDKNRMASLSVIDDSLSRNIAQAIAIVNQDIGVYEMLYNKLMYVNATKNASSLFSLMNDLNNYKKQARKRY